MLFFMISNYNL